MLQGTSGPAKKPLCLVFGCVLMMVVAASCGRPGASNGAVDTLASATRPVIYLQLDNPSILYCPHILANARHPESAPTGTPTPGATAPPSPTPTPRLLLSRTVSAGIPPGDMIMIIEAVRQGRSLEPGGDVADDLLVNIAGNAMYGAQLQPILEISGYRILECATAIVVETPLGEIWILKGHVWARHPLPWLTPTA